MAKPIELSIPPHDPREILRRRLEGAPARHAEALLDAYDILQLLHDRGIFELAKGLLGSGEKVLLVLAKALEGEESVSFVRNLTILARILGGMSPEMLEDVQRILAAHAGSPGKTPGLWRVFRGLSASDSRRTLAAMAAALSAAGKHLREGSALEAQVGRKPETFRHSA